MESSALCQSCQSCHSCPLRWGCICSDINFCGAHRRPCPWPFSFSLPSRPMASRARRGTGHLPEEFHRPNGRSPLPHWSLLSPAPGVCEALFLVVAWPAHCPLPRLLQTCQPARPATTSQQIRQVLPGQQRRSLTNNWTAAPFAPRQSSPHSVFFPLLWVPMVPWMGPHPKVPHAVGWYSHGNPPTVSSALVSSARLARVLIPSLHLPRFEFLGVLLLDVPRFSLILINRISKQPKHGRPCQRTGHLVAPWPQHHSAISISFRPAQTKTRAPVPRCQVACSERSNKGARR